MFTLEIAGRPVTITDDVTEEVQALARRAIERLGRIDVWFNNAGMDAFGRFEDIPAETFERVPRINLIRYPQREVFEGASGWMASGQYAAQPSSLGTARERGSPLREGPCPIALRPLARCSA